MFFKDEYFYNNFLKVKELINTLQATYKSLFNCAKQLDEIFKNENFKIIKPKTDINIYLTPEEKLILKNEKELEEWRKTDQYKEFVKSFNRKYYKKNEPLANKKNND